MTVGTSEDTYAFDGRSGDIDLLLWPVNFSLAYVGYWCCPRSSPTVSKPASDIRMPRSWKLGCNAWRQILLTRSAAWTAAQVIPFNRMAEWGADGRIVEEAAVHSPFVRRKQHLDLE